MFFIKLFGEVILIEYRVNVVGVRIRFRFYLINGTFELTKPQFEFTKLEKRIKRIRSILIQVALKMFHYWLV